MKNWAVGRPGNKVSPTVGCNTQRNPQEVSPGQHNNGATQSWEMGVYDNKEHLPTTILFGYISCKAYLSVVPGVLDLPELVVKTALKCVHRDTAEVAS